MLARNVTTIEDKEISDAAAAADKMTKLTPLEDATAGAIGSVLANTLVFPLDVIKTRLQVQAKSLETTSHSKTTAQYTSMLDAAVKIFKAEGILGLYAGLSAGLIGTVAAAFSYFYIYATVRGEYRKRIGDADITTAMELVLGAVSGAISQLFVLPITVVTTRQQTDVALKSKSLVDVMKQIVKEEGIQGLWKGLRAALVLCINPAITYGVFERLKGIIVKQNAIAKIQGPLTSGQVFMIGALSKSLATVVTYPYILAKVRMQWRPPSSINELKSEEREMLQYSSALDVLRKVYRTDGIKGIFNGISTQILKAVLCQAILFVSKEKLAAYTVFLFTLLGARNQAAAAIPTSSQQKQI
eukprot:jgi/Hompol1/3910/HPOL_003405-RA